MIISYEEFADKLEKMIQRGKDFYMDLLIKVIENPNRYCGLFRVSNAKTKLVQNATQSNEIKFGDFMENILTFYFTAIGIENLDKNIGTDDDGKRLNVDQLFRYKNNIVLIEQKVRDDHDSTKKRGQVENFEKKAKLLRKKYPDCHLICLMWFIDDSLAKNRKFYREELEKLCYPNAEFHLFYGDQLFEFFDNEKTYDVWNEINEYLGIYRENSTEDVIHIPDFSKSKEIYKALLELDNKERKKLMSDKPKYVRIRKELFSNGDNLEKASIERKKR